MHCSANIGEDGGTVLFFGLSGTGKTTLSTDPNRRLVGDDEHGWSDNGTFNFEGGCYAKCIRLSQEAEPEIWNAIRDGSVLENVVLNNGVSDYDDDSLTENTRVAYPLHYIPGAVTPSVAGNPKVIVFLTADGPGGTASGIQTDPGGGHVPLYVRVYQQGLPEPRGASRSPNSYSRNALGPRSCPGQHPYTQGCWEKRSTSITQSSIL